MKVKELIELLQQCDKELEVYGYCDHGQTPEKVSSPGVIWFAEKDAHSIWDGEFTYDKYEAEEHGFEQKGILL